MAKWIRTSAYFEGKQEPTTVVTSEDSLTVGIDEYVAAVQVPGAFVAYDVFECDGELEEAMAIALHRMDDDVQQREQNQAIGYHWNGMFLRSVTEHGILVNPAPWPFSLDDAKYLLTQIGKHPNYDHQVVMVNIVDERDNMTELVLKDGNITWSKRGQG